jgi:uncharacterized protein (DUF58 family)
MMAQAANSRARKDRRTARGRLKRLWESWLEGKLPRHDQLTLNHRNLYILPSKVGWNFAAVFLVLLLAAINEQVNLGYALSFLLGGAAMSGMYLTHGNLHGVSLRLLTIRSVHAGQVLPVTIMLSNKHPKQGRYGLQVTAGTRAPEGTRTGPGRTQDAELTPGSDYTMELDVATTFRGWLTLPRIIIETRYPLGLFRAWAYWRPQTKVLIWPALDPSAPPLISAGMGREGPQASRPGAQADDVPEGLRDYRRGDPLRLIAWKKSSHALPDGSGLVSRTPALGAAPDIWLDFDQSPGLQGLDAESRLSRLATWLLEAEQLAGAQGQRYGLKLPGQTVACSSGNNHLRHCLDTLAAWALPGDDPHTYA